MSHSSSDRFDSRIGAAALWGVSTAVATLCVGLKLSDAIPVVVPTFVPLLVTATLLGLNGLALWLDTIAEQPRPVSQRWSHSLPGLVGPALAGFAWSSAGAIGPIVGIVSFSLLALAGLTAWCVFEQRTRRTEVQPMAQPLAATPTAELSAETLVEPEELSRQSIGDEGEISLENGPSIDSGEFVDDPTIALRLLRRQDVGQDTIDVTARIEFAPGARQTSLHLPISPAMSSAPEVECEPLDDADVELSLGASYPYGIRIDARRSTPADSALTTWIGVQLQSPCRKNSAA